MKQFSLDPGAFFPVVLQAFVCTLKLLEQFRIKERFASFFTPIISRFNKVIVASFVFIDSFLRAMSWLRYLIWFTLCISRFLTRFRYLFFSALHRFDKKISRFLSNNLRGVSTYSDEGPRCGCGTESEGRGCGSGTESTCIGLGISSTESTTGNAVALVLSLKSVSQTQWNSPFAFLCPYVCICQIY